MFACRKSAQLVVLVLVVLVVLSTANNNCPRCTGFGGSRPCRQVCDCTSVTLGGVSWDSVKTTCSAWDCANGQKYRDAFGTQWWKYYCCSDCMHQWGVEVENDQTHIISFETSVENYDKRCYDSRSIGHGSSIYKHSQSKCSNHGPLRSCRDYCECANCDCYHNCADKNNNYIVDWSPCNGKLKTWLVIYNADDDGLWCNYQQLCSGDVIKTDVGNYELYHVKIIVHGNLVSGKSGMKKCTWRGSDFYIEQKVIKKKNFNVVITPDVIYTKYRRNVMFGTLIFSMFLGVLFVYLCCYYCKGARYAKKNKYHNVPVTESDTDTGI